jgi:LPS-assembly lipoprotein
MLRSSTLKHAALAGLLALGLAGCLRPLYGSPEFNGAGAQAGLAGVRVSVEGERLAHYLRNELEFNLRGGDPAAVAAQRRYELTITTGTRTAGPIVDRVAGVAESAIVTIEARYVLKEIGKSPTLNEGTAVANVSYDRSLQRFANVRAARDAEIQAARVLADQIRSRVASYLATR